MSALIVIVFTIQEAAWAAPELAAMLPEAKAAAHFALPASVATIEDSYAPRRAGESAPLIVLIQDAHANLSGQENLAAALEQILPAENIRTVYLEASEGDVSLTFLKNVPIESRRREGGASLKSGRLQGVEYANLVSDYDFSLWGVEDPELYDDGLRIYSEIVGNRERFSKYLAKMDSTIRALKPRIYGGALAAFDARRAAYAAGELPLTEYADVLLEAAARTGGAGTERVPHLKALRRLRAREARIDFAKASEEERAALDSLDSAAAESLKTAAREAGRFAAADIAATRAFFAKLEEALRAENIPVRQKFPELFKYCVYLEKAALSDPKTILEETEALERAVFDSLARNEDERGLRRVEENASILSRLLDLSLSPADFERYRREGRFFDTIYLTGFLNGRIAELGSHYENALFLDREFPEVIAAAASFYDLTLARDKAFVARTLARMHSTGEKAAALVTGGYHAPHLKRLFREQGIAYISVIPSILHETDRALYEKLLLENMPRPAAGPARPASAQNMMVRHLVDQARRRVASGTPFDKTELGRFAAGFGDEPARTAASAVAVAQPVSAARAPLAPRSDMRLLPAGSRLERLQAIWERRFGGYVREDLYELNGIASEMAADAGAAGAIDFGSMPAEEVATRVEWAATANGEMKAEWQLAFRIAGQIMNDFAHRHGGPLKREFYERCYVFEGAALRLDGSDPDLLREYAMSLVHTHRFAEAEAVYEKIFADPSRVGTRDWVRLAELRRGIAQGMFREFKRAQTDKDLHRALVLRETAFEQLLKASRNLREVTRYPDAPPGAYTEFASVERLRAEFDMILAADAEAGRQAFILASLDRMVRAVQYSNRALEIPTTHAGSQAHSFGTYATTRKIAGKVLSVLDSAPIELASAERCLRLAEALEAQLAIHQATQAEPDDLPALLDKLKRRLASFEESRVRVVGAVKVAADQAATLGAPVEKLFEWTEEAIASDGVHASEDAAVWAYLRGRFPPNWDTLDTAILMASNYTSNVADAFDLVTGAIRGTEASEFLGRLAAGRYRAFRVEFDGKLEAIENHEDHAGDFVRDPQPYSVERIQQSVDQDLANAEDLESMWLAVSGWPAQNGNRRVLIENLFKGLRAQIDLFVQTAAPYLVSKKDRKAFDAAARDKAREETKRIREGYSDLTRKDLHRAVRLGQIGATPYLPKIRYLRELIETERSLIASEIRASSDRVAQIYKTRAESLRETLGIALLETQSTHLGEIALEMKAIASDRSASEYLSRERFEELSTEADRIYGELDRFNADAAAYKKCREEIRRLASFLDAFGENLYRKFLSDARQKQSEFEERLRAAPFDDTPETVAERAQAIAAEVSAYYASATVKRGQIQRFADRMRERAGELGELSAEQEIYENSLIAGEDAEFDADTARAKDILDRMTRESHIWIGKGDAIAENPAALEAFLTELEASDEGWGADWKEVRRLHEKMAEKKIQRVRYEMGSLIQMMEWLHEAIRQRWYSHDPNGPVPVQVRDLEAAFAEYKSSWEDVAAKSSFYTGTHLGEAYDRAGKTTQLMMEAFLAFLVREHIDRLKNKPNRDDQHVEVILSDSGYPRHPYGAWQKSVMNAGSNFQAGWESIDGIGNFPFLDVIAALKPALSLLTRWAYDPTGGVPVPDARTLLRILCEDPAFDDTIFGPLPVNPVPAGERNMLYNVGFRRVTPAFKEGRASFFRKWVEAALSDREPEREWPAELQGRLREALINYWAEPSAPAGSRLAALNAMWARRKDSSYRLSDLDPLNAIAQAMVDSWGGAATAQFNASGLKRERIFAASLPGSLDDYAESLQAFAAAAKMEGGDAAEEAYWALRIAQQILDDLAHKAKFHSAEQRHFYELSFYLADAAIGFPSADSSFMDDYVLAMIHARRIAEAERFYAGRSDTLKTASSLVTFAKFKRNLANERLSEFRRALSERRFQDALILREEAFRNVSEAAGLLNRVIDPYLSNPSKTTQVAGAYKELAALENLRADYDIQALSSGLELKGQDFALWAMRRAAKAIEYANRALAVPVDNAISRKQRIAVYAATVSKTAKILRMVSHRRIDPSKIGEYDRAFQKIEQNVQKNGAASDAANGHAREVRDEIKKIRERLAQSEEVRRDVIQGMQFIAQQVFPDAETAVESFYSQVDEYLGEAMPDRIQEARSILAELRAMMSDEAGRTTLDRIDLAVIGASSRSTDLGAIAASAQSIVPEATAPAILGRWKNGRYRAVRLDLTGIVEPIEKEKPYEPDFKRDPNPYSIDTLENAVKNEPKIFEDADADYQRLVRWPATEQSVSGRISGLREGLREQIAEFVTEAQRYLNKEERKAMGQEAQQKLRLELKRMREGMQDMDAKYLNRAMRSGNVAGLPYLPKLREFRALVDDFKEEIARIINQRIDVIARSYKAKASEFQSQFGFKLLDAQISRLEDIAEEMRALLSSKSRPEIHYSYETFEELSAEAERIHTELSHLQKNVRPIAAAKSALRDLTVKIGALETRAPDALVEELRREAATLDARFSNIPYEKSRRSITARASAIAEDAAELGGQTEKIGRWFAELQMWNESLEIIRVHLGFHRGAFLEGTPDAVKNLADEELVEEAVRTLQNLHDEFAAKSRDMTLENHAVLIDELQAEEKKYDPVLREATARLDSIRTRKVERIQRQVRALRRMLEWLVEKTKSELYTHDEDERAPKHVVQLEKSLAGLLESTNETEVLLEDYKARPETANQLRRHQREWDSEASNFIFDFFIFEQQELNQDLRRMLDAAEGKLRTSTNLLQMPSVRYDRVRMMGGRIQMDAFGLPTDMKPTLYATAERDDQGNVRGELIEDSQIFEEYMRRTRPEIFATPIANMWRDFQGLGPLVPIEVLYTLRTAMNYFVNLATENDGVPIVDFRAALDLLYVNPRVEEGLKTYAYNPLLSRTDFVRHDFTGYRDVSDPDLKAAVRAFLQGWANAAAPDMPEEIWPEEIIDTIQELLLRLKRENDSEGQTGAADEKTTDEASGEEADETAGSRANSKGTVSRDLLRSFAEGVARAFGPAIFSPREARAETAVLSGAGPESAVILDWSGGPARIAVSDAQGKAFEPISIEGQRGQAPLSPAMGPEAGKGARVAELKLELEGRFGRRQGYLGSVKTGMRPAVQWIDLSLFSDLDMSFEKDAEIFDSYVEIYAARFLRRPAGYVGLLEKETNPALARRAESAIEKLAAKWSAKTGGGYLDGLNAVPAEALQVVLNASDRPGLAPDGRTVNFFAERIVSSRRGEEGIFTDAGASSDAMLGASYVVPAGKKIEELAASDIPAGFVDTMNDAAGGEERAKFNASDILQILRDRAFARRAPFKVWKLDLNAAFDLLRFVRSQIDRMA